MGYMVSTISSINHKMFFCHAFFSHLIIFLNRGEEESSASTIRKESRKFVQKPDYMTIVQLKKDVELEIIYLETGRSNSSQDKRRRDHKKLIQFSKDFIDTIRIISKLKRIFNQSSKRQDLTIFAINIAGIFTSYTLAPILQTNSD